MILTGHDLLLHSPMPLNWIKTDDGEWASLNRVRLEHEHFDGLAGVYIVWHGGTSPSVLRVGQGDIRKALQASREDLDVQAYSELNLYATWAEVVPRYRDGVEAYLARHYEPKIREPHPRAEAIAVELP